MLLMEIERVSHLIAVYSIQNIAVWKRMKPGESGLILPAIENDSLWYHKSIRRG